VDDARDRQGNRLIFMEKGALAPAFLLSGWVTTVSGRRKTRMRLRAYRAIHEIAVWANKNRN